MLVIYKEHTKVHGQQNIKFSNMTCRLFCKTYVQTNININARYNGVYTI